MSIQKQASSKISEEEMKKITEMFALYNMDGGDQIPIAQLGPMLRTLGQLLTEAELATIIADIDADGNGFVLMYEFIDELNRLRSVVVRDPKDPRTELEEAMRGVFDRERDGYMSAAEFQHVMTTIGEPVTDEDLEAMMKKFPPNGDGQVRCEDFIKCMFEFWDDSEAAKGSKPKSDDGCEAPTD